jgi:hypothetical protein
MLHNSPKICYNKQSIHYKSIDVFIPNITKKSDNGSSNEMRESIVGAIVNKQIPEIFFKNSVRWSTLKNKIFEYLFFIYLIDLKKLERRVTFPENLWRYFQSIVS